MEEWKTIEGNEGDIWEEEVQNLVFSDNEEKS
jgi:hypothetical protein